VSEHRAHAITPSPERGFVLVAVLWILMALSALAVIFSLYLSSSARALAVNDTALQAEALVSASLELTTYQLLLPGDQARPSHGSFHFGMDNADVVVAFTSEAARIDLNFAPKELLAGLFAGLGASEAAAQEEANRIVGWRTRPAPGAANNEEALYGAAGLGYSPRQSLFTHVNELALVAGLAPALVDRALPFVTVFNGSSGVDPQIAAPEVIAALPKTQVNPQANPQDNPNDVLGAVSAVSNGNPDATTDSPAPAQGNAPAAKSAAYRIETMINFNDGRRTASEVVIVLGGKDDPYRVLSWQDDVEPRVRWRKRTAL
jgi:general secretion pathway protein K